MGSKIKKKFLEKPAYNYLYKQYQTTRDPKLLQQLNQAYSDFINYMRLLSLIQTNVKYKGLHIKKKFYEQKQELVGEESLKYMINQKASSNMKHSHTQWDTVLESEELVKAVSTLSKRQQQILWIQFVEDIPAVQSRKQLNISQQSISKTRQRALRNIKKILEGKK